MNSVAAQPSARPLYAVFLERVIQIEAVQRHRAAVTGDDMAQFFSDFLLDAPIVFPWSWQGRVEAKRSVSLPMQHAWNAAPAAFEEFIKALKNGELIASGVHPATGVRRDLDRAEWTRTELILDVHDGDLIEVRHGKHTVLWGSITLRPGNPERKLGTVDWDDWWKHEVTRRKQGLLPNKKAYLGEAEPQIKERYGVTTVPPSELRRIKAALYRDDSERPKRPNRKQPKGKG